MWIWIIVALLALLVVGDDGGPIDELGDAIVSLTSSEEARLAKLEATTQDQARALIADLAADGITVRVGQTLRTPAQEKIAIDSGHSAVKTHSWHELGRALDLYPIDPSTGVDATGNDSDGSLDLYVRMHAAASARGFRGLAFNSDGSRRYITNAQGRPIWDGGHLEWRAPFGSISEAVAAEGPNYGIA